MAITLNECTFHKGKRKMCEKLKRKNGMKLLIISYVFGKIEEVLSISKGKSTNVLETHK